MLKTLPAQKVSVPLPTRVSIGGTAEKAMLMAKESLMQPIDMPELIARGPQSRVEELRIELYEKVNALGIGAQGLGGLTTVLDVKVLDYPCHAANLPVALVCTLYTNPFTIVPLYWLAYEYGRLLTGQQHHAATPPPEWDAQGFGSWLQQMVDWA